MYRTTLPQEAIDYVVEQVKQGNTTKSYIAKDLIKLFNIDGTLNAVRLRVAYLIDQIENSTDDLVSDIDDTLQELNESVEENKNYEIIYMMDRAYWKLWTSKPSAQTGESKKVEHLIPIEDDGSGVCLLNMCYDYSSEGGDLSQLEITNKYGIKREVRQQIKSTAKLYKKSAPIPDRVAEAIAEQKGEGHIDRVIGDISEKSLDKYGRKQREAIDRKFKTKAQEAIAILSNMQLFAEHLSDYMKTHQPRPYIIKELPQNNDRIQVVFGDLHNGEDSEETKKNFYKMTEKLCNLPQKYLDLFCLGDLVETLVVGGMHEGQVENMDNTDYVKLVMEVVEMLENMLIALAEKGKIVSFHGISGNHDRTTKSHIVGGNNMRGTIIYELVLRGVKDINTEVKYYQENINTVDIGDNRFIFHHGDDGFSKQAKTKDGPFRIAYKHGRKDGKNFILFGHEHSTYVRNPSDGLHVLGVPAISPTNHYAKAINLSSDAGFGLIDGDSISVNYI